MSADRIQHEIVQSETQPVHATMVTTTDQIPGFRITAALGLSRAIAVRGLGPLNQIGTGVRTILGGEASGYTSLTLEAQDEALATVRLEAARKGGNALVGLRLTTAEIRNFVEVVAFGTVVVAEPKA